MVLLDSDKIPRASSYSGMHLTGTALIYGTFTLYGCPSQNILIAFSVVITHPTTPLDKSNGLGYSNFARHYFRNL